LYELWVLTTFGVYRIRESNSTKLQELKSNVWYRFENLSWDDSNYVMEINSKFTLVSAEDIPKDIPSPFTPFDDLKPNLQNVVIFGIILKAPINSGTNMQTGMEVKYTIFIFI